MHFTDKMPSTTQRAHFKPSWRGDRYAAIARVGRKALGRDHIRAIDMNFQWGEHVAWAMHWSTPGKNNYRWILPHTNSVRARRMTRAEKRRPVSQWTDRQIALWRRGRSRASEHPITYKQAVLYAKKHNVVICAELKSSTFAWTSAAKYLVAAAKEADVPPWYMALYNMKNVRGKAKAVHEAGGQFAVIFGRFRRLARKTPSDWSRWNKYVTRVWGPARWKLGI